jgi:hypothetical protein
MMKGDTIDQETINVNQAKEDMYSINRHRKEPIWEFLGNIR